MTKILIRPKAIFIGPERTGTTWIYEYLRFRNDVCIPEDIKEIYYFDRHYDKGLRWYLSHWKNCSERNKIIEVGPTYFRCINAPYRIIKDIGKITIICTLRDPVKRAFSHYIHLLKYGYTKNSFREAVKDFPEIIDSSCYYTHIKRWIEIFGKENIKILFQEKLSEDQNFFVKQMCDYINLPFLHPPNNLKRRINKAVLPPNYYIAKCGNYISNLIRRIGFYEINEWARKVGLRKYFYGDIEKNQKRMPELKTEDKEWLIKMLKPEIKALKKILDIDHSDYLKWEI